MSNDLEVVGVDDPVDHLYLRHVTQADIPFITSSWMRSFRKAASVWDVPNTEFFLYEQRKLADLLPRATTLVLANKERPDQIVGFICYEKVKNSAGTSVLLHYVLIKHVFQGNGFGRLLVERILELEEPDHVVWTYRTKAAVEIIKSHPEFTEGWRHNPYLVYAMAGPNWSKNAS